MVDVCIPLCSFSTWVCICTMPEERLKHGDRITTRDGRTAWADEHQKIYVKRI